jgi:signal peptidase I
MAPTLKVGQIVTARNCPCSPSLDEIIVFKAPATAVAAASAAMCVSSGEGEGYKRPCGVPGPAADDQLFIKRAVGLPGDRIAIVDGHVARNGKTQEESFASACHPPAQGRS